jgi:hypothetical protein
MLCLSTAGAETSAPAETGLVQMQLEAAETGLVPAETQLKAAETGLMPAQMQLEAAETGLVPAQTKLKAAETGLVPAQAQFQMLCLSTHRHLRRQA